MTRIPRNKSAALMLLLEHAVRGYTLWTRGTVHHTKALRLAAKFDRLYDIGATPPQRVRRKQRGMANAHLVMYPDDHGEHVLWWLQATPGRGLVHEHESLFDTRERKQRLMWTHQYLLAYRQRSRRRGGRATWSWWLQPEYLAEWSSALRAAVYSHGRAEAHADAAQTPSRPDDVSHLARCVLRMPMFGGVRSQVSQMLHLTRTTWIRRYRRPAPFDWPATLPWMGTRLPLYGKPPLSLAALVAAMRQQQQELADQVRSEPEVCG